MIYHHDILFWQATYILILLDRSDEVMAWIFFELLPYEDFKNHTECALQQNL